MVAAIDVNQLNEEDAIKKWQQAQDLLKAQQLQIDQKEVAKKSLVATPAVATSAASPAVAPAASSDKTGVTTGYAQNVASPAAVLAKLQNGSDYGPAKVDAAGVHRHHGGKHHPGGGEKVADNQPDPNDSNDPNSPAYIPPFKPDDTSVNTVTGASLGSIFQKA